MANEIYLTGPQKIRILYLVKDGYPSMAVSEVYEFTGGANGPGLKAAKKYIDKLAERAKEEVEALGQNKVGSEIAGDLNSFALCEQLAASESRCAALAKENEALREDKERIGHRADRLFERASIVVHNLGALKTHYLQHVCLDNVRPEELASQIGYQRDQLEAVLNESPEHIVPPPVPKNL